MLTIRTLSDNGLLRACIGGTLLLMGALETDLGEKEPHTGLVIIGIFSAWTAFFVETEPSYFCKSGHGFRCRFSYALNAFSSASGFPENERGKQLNLGSNGWNRRPYRYSSGWIL